MLIFTYESDDLLYEGPHTYDSSRSPCLPEVLLLLGIEEDEINPDLLDVLNIIADQLCRNKEEAESIQYNRSVVSAKAALLPIISKGAGITSFPHNVSVSEQRRHLTYLWEAMKYKGTLYAIKLLFRGLLELEDVEVREMRYRTFVTFRTLLSGFAGGYTYSLGDATKQTERLDNRIVDDHLFGGKTSIDRILITVRVSATANTAQINEKISYAESLLPEFMPVATKYVIRVIS